MPSSDVMLSVTRRVFESPKCDICVWRPLRALQRSSNPLATNEEGGEKGEARDREKEGKEEGRKGGGSKRRKGKGVLPPLYLTSYYGPE